MWRKNPADTYLHTHIQSISTWRYVVVVEKTPQPTRKQKPRNVAKPKRNRTQLPPCGVP